MKKTISTILIFIIFAQLGFSQSVLDVRFIGRYTTNVYDKGATEIAAYDAVSKRLFSVNAFSGTVDIIDLGDPTNPQLFATISLASYGAAANSVAFKAGILAAAVENTDKQLDGTVVFFDNDGNYVNSVTVGALPDMITFTPDGKKVLAACEAEPNSTYDNDPLGIVAVIDISNGVSTLTQANVTLIDFSSYNNSVLDPSLRVFGTNATVAQDMEPEYIAISNNSKKAFVTLQENNGIAIIDLDDNTIIDLVGLGFKDYNVAGNGIDASDQNSLIPNIKNWPVKGMYQPDGIAFFRTNDIGYLITANEGDVREYGTFIEGSRVSSLALDPTVFPDAATLKLSNNLGRLNVTKYLGDTDFDGDYDELYSFGSRSFSIWNTDGSLVYDSGDDLEQITLSQNPTFFNCSNTSNTKQGRSDDKGPEPEGITTATILDHVYAFIGLERIGGVAVFDVTDPTAPFFVQYINTRDFAQVPGAGTGGDLGPEGMLFIPFNESPNGKNLLVVSNEISGSIAIFETDYLCDNDKVSVCFDGITYCIKEKKLASALENGGVLGECSTEDRLADNPNKTEAVKAYPNPSVGMVHFDANIVSNNEVVFQIFDFTGRVVEFRKISTVEGLANISIDFDASKLAAGIYNYSFTSGTNRLNGNVVISK